MDAIAELDRRAGLRGDQDRRHRAAGRGRRKTLYDNFDGKEDLFLSAFDATVAEMRAAVEEACERDRLAGGRDRRRARGAARLHRRAPGGGPDVHGRGDLRDPAAPPVSTTPAMRDFVELLRNERPRQAATSRRRSRSRWSAASPGSSSSRSAAARPSRPVELLPELSQFVLSPYLGVGKGERRPGGESDSTVADSIAGMDRLPRGRHGLSPEFVARNQRERLIAGLTQLSTRSGIRKPPCH